MYKMDDESTELLIELVCGIIWTELYDLTNPDYKDSGKAKNIWNEIGELMEEMSGEVSLAPFYPYIFPN